MSFSALIIESLQKQNEITVPGFGTFYLTNANAVLGTDGKSIFPPGKEIAFNNDFQDNENIFASYVAEKKNISVQDAEGEINKQVNFWNSILEKDGKLEIDHLGTFFLNDSKIHFTGKRIENLSPDFYGLEEINLASIKVAKPLNKSNDNKEYRTPKSFYWLIPLILGIAILSYLGVSQPELIFGAKSFVDEKPSIQKETIPLKKDSTQTQIIAIDSLQNDSANVPAIPNSPVRK